jgi:hypothetical protein
MLLNNNFDVPYFFGLVWVVCILGVLIEGKPDAFLILFNRMQT